MSVRRHARTRLPRLRTPRLLLAAVVLAALTVTGVGVAGAIWPQPDRATTPTAAASPYAAEPAPVLPDRTTERPDRGTRPYAEAPAASPTPAPQPPSQPEPDDPEPSSQPPAPEGGEVVTSGTCEASYYWEPQPTASGEVFDPEAMTAAHKTWAFGTRVRVTNPANGQSVVVRINDRGPYIDGRCLDLARGAFREIASLQQGVAMVNYEVLSD